MFHGNLLEVLLPVSIEFDLLFPVAVELRHNSIHIGLETLFELDVGVIAGFYYMFVVWSVHNGYIGIDFVLN